jgi:hypothetical protein
MEGDPFITGKIKAQRADGIWYSIYWSGVKDWDSANRSSLKYLRCAPISIERKSYASRCCLRWQKGVFIKFV